MLIPSNYPWQTLNNQRCSETKKELRSGNIKSKSAEFVVGSDSIVTLNQLDSIVAFASKKQ